MTTNNKTTRRLPKSSFRHAATAAAALTLLASATAAHAGQILLVNAIDQVNGGIATYRYAADGSGNFSASSRTLVTTDLRNNNWLVNGPSTGTVPYLWETDAFGGIKRYSTSGTSQQYVQAAVGFANNQSQSVEDSSGNAYVRIFSNSSSGHNGAIEKFDTSVTGTLLVATQGSGLAIGPDGNIYQANWIQGNQSTGSIEKYSTSGTDLGQFAAYSGNTPTELGFDSHGDLFALIGNTRIDEWGPTGSYIGTFKSGLPNTLGGGRAQDPNSMAIDGNDNIWLAQGYGSLYKISPTGTVTNFDLSNSGLAAYSVAILNTGNAAPEPSTALLLAGAGLLFAGRGRKLVHRFNKSSL